MPSKIDMAKFAKFCKDTGFIFQSSEIYGGINGFWDYGPLGVELKKNIKDAWWQDMVRNPPPGPDGDDVEVQDGVDINGQPTYTKERFPVNPELLKRISETTGGNSYIANRALGPKISAPTTSETSSWMARFRISRT